MKISDVMTPNPKTVMPTDDVQVAAAVPAVAGDRQAALGPLLGLLAHRRDVGVDQVADLAVDVPGEHPQADADLRRGEARPAGGVHGLGEVGDQPAQFGVEVDDGGRRGAEDRVTEEPDRSDAHRSIVCGGPVVPRPLPESIIGGWLCDTPTGAAIRR